VALNSVVLNVDAIVAEKVSCSLTAVAVTSVVWGSKVAMVTDRIMEKKLLCFE
jgi:hypothetical protein